MKDRRNVVRLAAFRRRKQTARREQRTKELEFKAIAEPSKVKAHGDVTDDDLLSALGTYQDIAASLLKTNKLWKRMHRQRGRELATARRRIAKLERLLAKARANGVA